MVPKIARSVENGLRGLREAYRRDTSFRIELWSLPIFILIGFLLWPLSKIELLVFVLSYLLILITELVNTSFEQMLERLHPEIHEQIGASKDIAASAVLLACFFALCVIVVLLLSKYGII